MFALRKCDLIVPAGSTVGVCGVSGSGKSTDSRVHVLHSSGACAVGCVAFVGAHSRVHIPYSWGAGKSTIVALLERFYDPAEARAKRTCHAPRSQRA